MRHRHSASPNRQPESVRLMLVCDFQKDGTPDRPRTFYNDQTLGGWNWRTQCIEQFHVDTRKWQEDLPPDPDDMWADWAI